MLLTFIACGLTPQENHHGVRMGLLASLYLAPYCRKESRTYTQMHICSLIMMRRRTHSTPDVRHRAALQFRLALFPARKKVVFKVHGLWLCTHFSFFSSVFCLFFSSLFHSYAHTTTLRSAVDLHPLRYGKYPYLHPIPLISNLALLLPFHHTHATRRQ